MKVITERAEWNNILQKHQEASDIYYNYDYFDIYARHFNAKSEMIVWEDQHISIFWPHLVRDIPNKLVNNRRLFDLITPYGYGGPLICYNTNDSSDIQRSLHIFMKAYLEFAKEKNYICEFIRFHPLIKNWEPFCEDFLDVIAFDYNNDTVSIDLSCDLEQIWREFRKGHRYDINKTERENCEVKILSDPSERDVDAFISLYYATMENCHASQKYFFSPSFIKDHFSQLSAILIKIDYCGKMIGASMFITGGSYIHYHLSGSNNDIKGIYPSVLIIWEAIKWAKENNFTHLHLGGGLGENDSLFNFKRGFSKATNPHYTGKIIFNYEQYNALIKLCSNSNINNKFFPGYRSELSDTII
ncbi:MAG TPA: GNAT family N-acetyltransferase [Bacteroidales bacterium]|nr:GNAT family N-acetyltransferase [Bacteroidales bacterium]